MKHAKVTTSHIRAVTGTTFVSTLSWLLGGFYTAQITGVVDALDHFFISPRGLPETASNLLLGFTVCSALAGTIFGALIARRAAELLGRKRSMIIAATLFLVSSFGSAFPDLLLATGAPGADALWLFICFRVLGGVGMGLASLVAPMHVSEFAPSALRGQLGAYQQIAIAGGIVIVLFVSWGIGLQGDDNWMLQSGWRYIMVSLAVPSLALLWLSFAVPESPRWLVKNGRIEEARRELSRSADPEEIRTMLDELSQGTRNEPAAVPLMSFGIRVLVIGIVLNVLQQLIGLTAISYYGPQILQRMGYHMDTAMLGVLVARSLNFLATMVVVLIVDRVGRRPLLIVGALVMGVSMMALASMFQMQSSATFGLIAMCCYLIGLGISFGPIVWIILSEMYPAPIRAQAMSMTVTAQWGANFLVAVSFPVLFGSSALNAATNGGFAFWIYGGFSVLAAFVVLRFVPETKGIDSERLDAFWRRQTAIASEPARA
jgi:MFS transporter, SP family, xylose:H+ symportor